MKRKLFVGYSLDLDSLCGEAFPRVPIAQSGYVLIPRFSFSAIDII